LHALREFWLDARELADASAADIEAFDKMAEESGYLPGISRAVGGRVWALMATQHKSLNQAMAEQGLSTGDEIGPSEEVAGWIQDGKIMHAFKAFAYFCGVLAARRIQKLERLQKSEHKTGVADIETVADALAIARSNDMRQGLEGELSALLNEILSMHKPDGRIFEKVRARVSLPRIFIADVQLPIETGDRLIRPLPNGLKDEFIVDEPGYRHALGDIPARFEVTVHATATTASTESATDASQSASPTNSTKRGRRPNALRRDAIASAINKHGDDWRVQLPEILRDLDSNDVFLGDFTGMKIDLGDDQTTTVSKWEDLDLSQGEERKKIIDVLRKYVNRRT
jgi:hypothetical protein